LTSPPPWWIRWWTAIARPEAGGVRWRLATAAAAAAILLVVGFVAGRGWTVATSPDVASGTSPATGAEPLERRVLLLTVADHLEQSERVLTDLVNAPGDIDISTEQRWASDLVAASRLYRQDALATNEASVVAVLDELERALLDIVHRPSLATDADLDEIRRRVESASLLFKVRVMSHDLRELTEDEQDASFQPTGSIG
jgi:hypothetical protein